MATTAANLRVVNLSDDPDNSDLTAANVNWKVIIIEHFYTTATGVGSDQIKILGLTRDPNNQDVSVAGSVWRVMINENMLGYNSAGI